MKKKYRITRNIVQLFFALLTVKIGYQFYGFVRYCETAGGATHVQRPPSVEAFLPISSLMSLKYLFLTGEINPVHPSGLVIFTAILVIAIVLKKAFCGWICPVGFMSEALWKTGEKIFGKTFRAPTVADGILRSLKYLLLAFFAWIILVAMDVNSIRSFIYSPYNKVADVKMLLFWTHISRTAIIVVAVLAALSVVVRNFWCRYLCPYGALLGALSIVSPFKITRNPDTCTGCMKCTRVCPSGIAVHSRGRVRSDECMACMACVESCPVDAALKFSLPGGKMALTRYSLTALVVGVYFSFVVAGIVSGNWKNGISTHEYVMRIRDIDNPIYDHNRGKVLTEEPQVTHSPKN